jgi:hypothetical protein
MTSVISWFSITITNTWLKFGRAATGDGVGLGVGDGLGLGVGVGDGVGVGVGDGVGVGVGDGEGDGDGEGLGVGDGDGDGDGDGEGVGVGAGAGLPAWKLATMPLAQAGVVRLWVALYEPLALTTWALRIASLTGLLSCLFTRL